MLEMLKLKRKNVQGRKLKQHDAQGKRKSALKSKELPKKENENLNNF